MSFKIVQKSEFKKIVDCLSSDDVEMRQLGRKLAGVREVVRFSLTTLVLFNCFLFLLTLTGICWAWEKVAAVYHYPLVVFALMQLVGSFIFVRTLVVGRANYNVQARVIDNWLD